MSETPSANTRNTPDSGSDLQKTPKGNRTSKNPASRSSSRASSPTGTRLRALALRRLLFLLIATSILDATAYISSSSSLPTTMAHIAYKHLSAYPRYFLGIGHQNS
ncbi:hypothetical protein BT96DRAFT_997765 [Gymnopus androsaceus JB14]|uniref:Uncharacterized protein n=1 Tax=Gymnopus androsaceus JB14 TaxID=1447944 RepID=A0A6A4HB30_9AGAR|nr:hypothetical protein BT96DRAFT_997765 [Gymnopus androsaceus JB14]